LFPIIAVIRELKRFSEILAKSEEGVSDSKKAYPLDIYFVGPKNEMGIQLLKNEGVRVKTILTGKIRRYFTIKSVLQNFIDIAFKIPIGFIQASFYLKTMDPHIIFSKGGYGALPIVSANRWFKIPIFFTNQILCRARQQNFLLSQL